MNRLLFTTFLFLIMISAFADFPLKAKLKAYVLHQKVVAELTKFHDIKSFNAALEKLPQDKKNEAKKLIKEFDDHFPEEVLVAFIHYRYLEPSPEKLEDILTFLMISKATVLRDQSQNNPHALKGLKKFTEHKKVTPDNLEKLMLPLYREKAHFLANMKDDALFYDALKSSPLFYFDLSRYLGSETIVSMGPIGSIPGHHYELAGEVDISEHLRSAKQNAIIDAHFFVQNKFHKEILNWVKISSPDTYKLTLVSHHEVPKELSQTLKKYKSPKVELISLQEEKLPRSQFHEHLHKMHYLLIDPFEKEGRLIHHDQVSQIIQGPIVSLFYGLLLHYSETPNFLDNFPESVPHLGDKRISLSFSSPDRTFTNLRSSLIKLIVEAKKSLLLDQFFLYDPVIIDALLKKKIKDPKVEIKAFVDMSPRYEMNGLPNTLYLKELTQMGIELRTKKTTTKNQFIIDEKKILVGHPHLNPDTLDGHHFEAMFLVDSPQLAEESVKVFRGQWKDPKTTYRLDLENFRVRINGETLRKPSSQVVNDIGGKLLRNRKFILR